MTQTRLTYLYLIFLAWSAIFRVTPMLLITTAFGSTIFGLLGIYELAGDTHHFSRRSMAFLQVGLLLLVWHLGLLMEAAK